MTLRSEVLQLPDSPEAAYQAFLMRQWDDGLPVSPPTVEGVEAMLATFSRAVSRPLAGRRVPSSLLPGEAG